MVITEIREVHDKGIGCQSREEFRWWSWFASGTRLAELRILCCDIQEDE
jgi:hypothetical protein